MDNKYQKLSGLVDFDFEGRFDFFRDDESYHADRGFVSSSSLRKVLISPRAWYYDFVLGKKEKPTAAMDFGTLVHDVVLNGRKFVVVPKFTGLTKDGKESTRSKAADEQKQAFLASLPADTTAVAADDYEAIQGILEALNERPESKELLTNGWCERSAVFADPVSGLKMKIKPDFLSNDYRTIVDLKTTKRADRVSVGRTIFDLRYDFQLFMYAYGVEVLTGVRPERVIILAVEKEPPFEVGIYEFSPHDFFVAQSDFVKCAETLSSCIMENTFPMRQQQIENVYVPQWWVNMKTEESI